MDLIQAAYFVVAILFIVGLKRMAHPTTAKSGIVWAGWGMVLAVLATFFWPGMGNFALILLALLLGSVVAWWAAVRVAMTDMPQMVAIYNGMGGGAAATIAAVALLSVTGCAVTRDQQSVGAYVDDTAITTNVKARFYENKDVAGSSISVETLNGVVMLSGFATGSKEKSIAESIARNVNGVKGVKNEIAVRP